MPLEEEEAVTVAAAMGHMETMRHTDAARPATMPGARLPALRGVSGLGQAQGTREQCVIGPLENLERDPALLSSAGGGSGGRGARHEPDTLAAAQVSFGARPLLPAPLASSALDLSAQSPAQPSEHSQRQLLLVLPAPAPSSAPSFKLPRPRPLPAPPPARSALPGAECLVGRRGR